MRSSHEESTLLEVPAELRQNILQLALQQKGTVQLQYPVWASHDTFTQPLFQVCRSLRIEALQAFYETNTFVWVIDVNAKDCADVHCYASTTAAPRVEHFRIANGPDSTLIPVMPWTYPHLWEDLRHLKLNVYLPNNEDTPSGRKWSPEFRDALGSLIVALNGGWKLAELDVLIGSRWHFNRDKGLTVEQTKILGVLLDMNVRGKLTIQTRNSFLKETVRLLNQDREVRSAKRRLNSTQTEHVKSLQIQ